MPLLEPTFFFLSFILIGTGFVLGLVVQNYFSNKIIKNLSMQIADLGKGQAQLQRDYNLLLEAMNGAKIQAENFQREILGTNIVEVKEHEDPEKILNRHLLADYIYKQLNNNASKTDETSKAQIPGDPKVIESLEMLDDRVVDILAAAIK